MNQILDFGDNYKNNKKGNNNRNLVDIKKVIIVFAIILIIFGIGIIATTVYNIYGKNTEEKQELSKPTITLTQNEETGKLDIVVQNNNKYAIDKIVYKWEGQEEKVEEGKNRNYINLSIDIPSGTNKLSIKAIDKRNISVSYEKEFVNNKSEIKLAQGNGGVSISVVAQENIEYITYKWNNEEEEKVDVNANEYETTIKVPQGENILTVTAVGTDGSITKEETKIQGIIDEKPEINVSIDSENFIITAYDDEEIEKVIIRANGEDTTIEVGNTDFEYKVPFIEGYNEIRIKVYNVNGLTNSTKATLNK